MTLEAVILDPGAGDTLSLRGTKVRVLTTAATSIGASTFEFVAAPGWDTGSHFHSKIEEQFYVIDGELELRAGERLIVGRPGTFIAVPPGTPHAFANRGDLPATMLLVATPPGHERYFADLAEILARPGAPDPDEIAALRARFDTTQVSSLTT
ncbi:MAG TPA: cupin domain-containing protein [Jatrophihabitantaceae bacterium]|nr:cupin domain-containing protein [Jatrophihabitantaceae bacterium]